jgi:hypothetical protein
VCNYQRELSLRTAARHFLQAVHIYCRFNKDPMQVFVDQRGQFDGGLHPGMNFPGKKSFKDLNFQRLPLCLDGFMYFMTLITQFT